MPDRRLHRGPHPDDARLFSAEWQGRLQSAVSNLSWLSTRGYSSVSALKLVGDRYALEMRQRTAVARCACSDQAHERRLKLQIDPGNLQDRPLLIDGYNVLTTVEAALAGGVILHARDGTFRDLASMHGTWRKVQETVPAAEFIGQLLADLGISESRWLLDRPVSNSGRLATLLRDIAAGHAWNWTVELCPNPDAVWIAATDQIVATADSGILDRSARWANVARTVVERFVRSANIVRLTASREE